MAKNAGYKLKPDHLRRVVLVSVDMPNNYSLGMPLIKAYASSRPFLKGQVDILHMSLPGRGRAGTFKLLASLFINRPHLIAISCNVWSMLLVAELVDWLGRLLPKSLLVLGGGAICEPLSELETVFPSADVLIEGEGEAVFADLLERLLESGGQGLKDVLGISYRDPEGNWQATPPRPIMKDLDSIPSAYLSGLVQVPQFAWSGAMIEITRGCPYHCGYCFEALRYQHQRSFSIERAIEEVGYLLKKGVKRIHILDPSLYASRRMEQFGELLCGFDLSGVEISAEIYAESITPDNIGRIGFVTHCDIGLQTISPQAAEAVGRPWRQDRFEQGYHLLKKAGKELNCSMIVGLPGENLKSFIAGMNYVEEELDPCRIMYNHLLLLRGTPLRREAAKHGIVYDPVPPYPVLQTASMPETDMKKALALAGLVMQSGWSRRRLANPDYLNR